MSIEFQKNIKWIPFLNLITILCTLSVLIKKRLNWIPTKNFVKVFALVSLLTLLETMIEHFLFYEWLFKAVHCLSVYFQLYFVSSFGIEIQEEVIKNEKK